MDKTGRTALNEKLASHFNLPFRWYTDNLDDCFKGYVPKLLRRKITPAMSIEFFWDEATNLVRVDISPSFGAKSYSWGEAETSALALCLATERLIDDKTN